jgi:tRNA(fMet)-specific endonuclease VapC
MILSDSDHLSVLLDERDVRCLSLDERLEKAQDVVALPIVCVEEQLRGWLAMIHRIHDRYRQVAPYLRLKKTFTLLRDWPIVEWNEPAADQFSRLRSLRHRIGSQDLKIACIALANDALLLSANLRDFEQVPGLRVEDWLE